MTILYVSRADSYFLWIFDISVAQSVLFTLFTVARAR